MTTEGCNHNPVLSSSRVCNRNNTMGATNVAGTLVHFPSESSMFFLGGGRGEGGRGSSIDSFLHSVLCIMIFLFCIDGFRLPYCYHKTFSLLVIMQTQILNIHRYSSNSNKLLPWIIRSNNLINSSFQFNIQSDNSNSTGIFELLRSL